MFDVPDRDIVQRLDPQAFAVGDLTKKVLEALGDSTLQDGLTVLVNVAGHLLAATCEGRPSAIQEGANDIAESIKRAAISKILHDDDVMRGSD